MNAVGTVPDSGPPAEQTHPRTRRRLSGSISTSGSEDNTQEGVGAESGEEAVPTVFDLRCGACEHVFCRRGMQVHLVADVSASLFSTDFRPIGVVEEDVEREHGCCRCRIRDVACDCGHIIGYHVIQPCSTCNATGHNDHYWQMNKGMVIAEPRLDMNGQPITWCSSSAISSDLAPLSCVAQTPRAAVGAGSGNAEEVEGRMRLASAATGVAAVVRESPPELCCPICRELMVEPRWPPCRHAACLLCLTRAVDLRRMCPCCRQPTTCSELLPAEALAARIQALPLPGVAGLPC